MSSLQVNNVVIHQLEKRGSENDGYSKEYKLRKEENDVTDVIIELTEKLHENYIGRENSVQRGIFENDTSNGEGKFAKYFLAKELALDTLKNLTDDCKKYYPEHYIPKPDNHFYNLSVCFMNELKEKGKSGTINGGLLFFADYNIKHYHFFIVVMFEQEEGFNIDKLDVKRIESIDIKKLKQAIRINRKILQEVLSPENSNEDKENYVSFVSTGNAEIKEFFIKAAGCRKEFSNAKATKEMYTLVEKIVDTFPNLVEKKWDISDSITDYYDERIKNHSGKVCRTDLIDHVVNYASQYCSEIDLYDESGIIKSVSKDTLRDTLLIKTNDEDSKIPLHYEAVSNEVDKKKKYIKTISKSYLRIDLDDIGSSVNDMMYFDETKDILIIKDPELVEKYYKSKESE